MRTEELLALGVFGRGSRLRERIEMLLERGREFSPRASRARLAVSGIVLLGPKMKERTPGDGGAPFSMLMNGFHVPGRNASMAELAYIIETLIPPMDRDHDDRPVLDMTGLTGRFDFDLTFAPAPSVELANAPDLFTAVQEQLGLKLEATKGPVETFVVDHAEKPDAN